jgi:uncharacterized integral membrane protein
MPLARSSSLPDHIATSDGRSNRACFRVLLVLFLILLLVLVLKMTEEQR